MAIKRDVKTLARRIDRHYIERRSAVRRVRLALIVLCCAVAVGWWALASRGNATAMLYNPAHVTAVHASFERDCRACHDGDGKGGFLLSVSDNACMKCHDGSIHHENQKLAKISDKLDRDGNVLAVSDSHHTAGMRSASCVSCHTEHRGEELMKGTSDVHCIKCHANLNDASMSTPKAQSKVIAFNATDHPAFGRELMQKDGETTRIVDPTRLEFNHRKHAGVAELQGDNSCIKCHETREPSPAATQFASAKKEPPYALPGDAPIAWANQADQRYIQPVSFDRHCVSCHQISGPSVVNQIKRGPRVTNESLLPEAEIPHLAMKDVRTYAAAHVAKSITAKNFLDAKARDEFIAKAAAKLGGDLSKAKLRTGTWEGQPVDFSKPPTDQDGLGNLYAAAIATSAKGCVLCHSLQQEGGALTTVPTKIPDSPRVWFTNSQFDHRKHRNMSCVECHSTLSEAYLAKHAGDDKLPQAEETSFFNSPNLSWAQTVKEGVNFGEITRSCVECHHKDDSQSRGVASNCVSCHNFHDRTKEQR
jgi:hypothetical protein